MSLLRSVFAVAWIVIPPLAGWLAARSSVYAVFGISAVAHVGCTLAIALLWSQEGSAIGVDRTAPQTLPPARIATGHRFGTFGVALSMIALQLNISVLPLVIVRDLGGTLGQVGINFAVAAAIEVPVMIGWGYLALRWRKESILSLACFVFAVYFVLLTFADSFAHVLILQVPAAIAIAALLSINISYLQEAIPGRVGLSTSLVDVTNVVAALSAAVIFAANPLKTYVPLMGMASVLCFAGSIALSVAAKVTPEETAK